jgi:dihydrofolate reductase
MRMEIVVAVSENDVIGRRNELPWRLPSDLRRFKTLTLGKPVLMGRRTYESIGRALPGRTNIVLSRSGGFAPGDCVVAATLERALEAAAEAAAEAPAEAAAEAAAEASGNGSGDARGDASAVMIIGGAEIYRQTLPSVSRIHLTLVHTRIEDGDAFFDAWRSPEWRESGRERHDADEKNTYPYSFLTLDRAVSSGSRDSTARPA